MITITIVKNQSQYKQVECLGHAGYANSGKDIVCASVSVLVLNTINAIETLTSQRFNIESDEDIGMIQYELIQPVCKEAHLLLDALILGLTEIEKQYGKKYLKLKFKEV